MNPLAKITKENITQEDLDLLNLVRLGFIPVAEWSEKRNLEKATVASGNFVDMIPTMLGRKEITDCKLEEIDIIAKATQELAFQCRLLLNELSNKADAKETAAKRAEMAKYRESREAEKQAIANAKRDEKPKKAGKKAATVLEKLVKSVIQNAGTRIPSETEVLAVVRMSFPSVEEYSDDLILCTAREFLK